MDIAEKGYAHPEALVSTEWVADHLDDPNVRIVESDEDILLYETGHIPGAVKIDWQADLNDPLVRDYIEREQFEALMAKNGISNETTVVFYGDKNNWWACYAFWVFQLFGHTNAKIMDGGRAKWVADGRAMTREVTSYPATTYTAAPRNDGPIRAFRDEVLAHVRAGKPLVDVRSPGEYKGELLHMPDYPQEGRCAAVTSRRQERAVGVLPTKTAPSNLPTNCAPSTSRSRVLRPVTTSSPTAASASAAAILWFVLTYLWATIRCATMTAPGPSGECGVGMPVEK
ncbi:MAG: rhodanese-like domain-containing protein [Caldilineaceae bacterium]